MAGVCEVFDDAAHLSQALFRVDALDGWEHGPSDVLGCLHHPLEGFAVMDGEIPVGGPDTTGEDTQWCSHSILKGPGVRC